MNSLRRSLSASLPILLLLAPAVMAQPAQCPSPAPNPPPVTISPDLPRDVCLPKDETIPGIAFFDDFSWRSFVALVWPTTPGAWRGSPSLNARPGDSGRPPGFALYKADWEVFQPDGSEPSPWSSKDSKSLPCGPDTSGSWALQLAAYSKFGNVRLATFGGFAGPLISPPLCGSRRRG